MQINPIQSSKCTFGVKVPTRDVLEVVTNRVLTDGIKGTHNLCNAMTGRPTSTIELLYVAPKCTESLLRQFPVLADSIKSAKEFFVSHRRTSTELEKWVTTQIERIGASELDVNPISIDKKAMEEATAEVIKNTKIMMYMP